MNIKQAVLATLAPADMIVGSYLADLADAELLVRPVPGANHIAWQLGHLISSEAFLVKMAVPSCKADLPPGFAERHTKDTASIDAPAGFDSKTRYLELAKGVRSGVLASLDSLSPEDFDRPVSGGPPFVKTVGDTFLFLGAHWLMHAGQWTVLRRKIGRPSMF